MADFRKVKYSGSLNLAPECGPVLIELDTEAKTATASLEDPDSQYTIAGGGGGLEYVIPEQTVTITQNPVTISINDISGLQAGDEIIMKLSKAGDVMMNYWPLQMQGDGYLSGSYVRGTTIFGVDITPSGSSGDLYIYNAATEEDAPGTYTISAVSGF